MSSKMATRQTRAHCRQSAIPAGRPPLKKTTALPPSTRPTLGNVTNRASTTQLDTKRDKKPLLKQPSKLSVATAIPPHTTALPPTSTTTLPPTSTTTLPPTSTTALPPTSTTTLPPHLAPTFTTIETQQRDETASERERAQTPQPMDVGEVAMALQRQLQMVEDVDEGDRGNPLLCAEYVKDIYRYLRELETRYHPDPAYMSRQTRVNPRMRAILVDWLVLVQMKFSLLQETLFLTVAIIDRFLEVFPAPKEQLQLIGVTAMLIASKYEEIYYPPAEDFVYITDHTYSVGEMQQMERIILRTLGYSLASPAPISFLRRFSKIAEVTPRMHTLAKFLIELSLTDYSMLQFLPSQLAAASLSLAMRLSKDGDSHWTSLLEHYSGYSDGDLTPCMVKLAQLVKKVPVAKQQAVREKYSNSRFLRVAKEPSLFGRTVRELAAMAAQ